jgi:hypothetical protein
VSDVPLGRDWLPRIKEVIGIEGDIDHITLVFKTHEFLQAYTGDGRKWTVNLYGIDKIRQVLGLPSAAKLLVIEIKKDGFVTIRSYEFSPIENPIEQIVELLTEVNQDGNG